MLENILITLSLNDIDYYELCRDVSNDISRNVWRYTHPKPPNNITRYFLHPDGTIEGVRAWDIHRRFHPTRSLPEVVYQGYGCFERATKDMYDWRYYTKWPNPARYRKNIPEFPTEMLLTGIDYINSNLMMQSDRYANLPIHEKIAFDRISKHIHKKFMSSLVNTGFYESNFKRGNKIIIPPEWYVMDDTNTIKKDDFYASLKKFDCTIDNISKAMKLAQKVTLLDEPRFSREITREDIRILNLLRLFDSPISASPHDCREFAGHFEFTASKRNLQIYIYPKTFSRNILYDIMNLRAEFGLSTWSADDIMVVRTLEWKDQLSQYKELLYGLIQPTRIYHEKAELNREIFLAGYNYQGYQWLLNDPLFDPDDLNKYSRRNIDTEVALYNIRKLKPYFYGFLGQKAEYKHDFLSESDGEEDDGLIYVKYKGGVGWDSDKEVTDEELARGLGWNLSSDSDSEEEEVKKVAQDLDEEEEEDEEVKKKKKKRVWKDVDESTFSKEELRRRQQQRTRIAIHHYIDSQAKDGLPVDIHVIKAMLEGRSPWRNILYASEPASSSNSK